MNGIPSRLTLVVALGVAGIGVGALAAPRRSAAQYGLPVTDEITLAYVRALGSRDLVLGLLFASLLAGHAPRRFLATAAGLSALSAATDFALVASTANANRKALPLHAAGIISLLTLAALLALGPEPPFDPSH